VDEYFGQACELAQSLELKLCLPRTTLKKFEPGTPGRKRYDWPWSGAYISFEGYMMPCCMVSPPTG
jgi:hypothetical protein